VFPEYYLTGMGSYGTPMPPGYLEQVAQAIPGPLTDRICDLARQTRKWIVPGSIVERDGANLHNTAIAVSHEGEIVARYRKLFPWMPYETSVPGNEHVTFDIPGVGRFGLAICYDGWVPEIIRTLAWMGAEVILQPTYTRTSDRTQELILAQANAIANQVYVVNPNIGSSSVRVGPLWSIPRARARPVERPGVSHLFSTWTWSRPSGSMARPGSTHCGNSCARLRPSRQPSMDMQGEVMRDLGPFPMERLRRGPPITAASTPRLAEVRS
jgi:formamidase